MALIGKVQMADAAKKAVPELTTEQAVAIGSALETKVRKELSHELRKQRFQRRQLGRQLGRAAATIHELRAEVALLRQQRRDNVRGIVRERLREMLGDGFNVVEMEPIDLDAPVTDGHDTGNGQPDAEAVALPKEPAKAAEG